MFVFCAIWGLGIAIYTIYVAFKILTLTLLSLWSYSSWNAIAADVASVGDDSVINIQVTVLCLSAQCVQWRILPRIHRGTLTWSVRTGRCYRCRGGGALRRDVGRDRTPWRDLEDLTCLPTLSGVSVQDITCGSFQATKRNTFDGSRSFPLCCWLSVSVTSFGSDQASPLSPCAASIPYSHHHPLRMLILPSWRKDMRPFTH